MWKRLDESISLSEKLAGLSWMGLGTWAYLLPNVDSMGRYPRDPRIVKAKCMTLRYDVRLELVEEALLEIERAGLLHRYDVGQKAFLVLHNAAKYNPPGALGNVSPRYPAPPDTLCECLTRRRENGALAPVVTSRSVTSTDPPPEPPDSPESRLYGLAVKAKIRAISDRQLKQYVNGWLAEKGYQFTEAVLMNPKARGKDVLDVNNEFFRPARNGKPAQAPQKEIKCRNCGDSGVMAGGTPCNSCRRKEIGRVANA